MLALTILIFVFLTELIAWIEQDLLLERAHAWSLRMSGSPLFQQQRELKAEIYETKQELMKTSSQDQFSKWARLRRKLDKGIADLDKLNSQIAMNRAAFGVKFKSLLWAATSGVQFLLSTWYSRTAVFYLPPSWFGPATWWLALPFAPAGSVSCGVWSMACKRVLQRFFVGFKQIQQGRSTI